MFNKNYLYLYLYSVNYKKLKYFCYKIIKLVNMFFVYNLSGKFCKFFFFYFNTLGFFKASGSGSFPLLKSPHVNKKAQAHFKRYYYRALITFHIPFAYSSLFLYIFGHFLNKVLQVNVSFSYKFYYKQKFINSYFLS